MTEITALIVAGAFIAVGLIVLAVLRFRHVGKIFTSILPLPDEATEAKMYQFPSGEEVNK